MKCLEIVCCGTTVVSLNYSLPAAPGFNFLVVIIKHPVEIVNLLIIRLFDCFYLLSYETLLLCNFPLGIM